MREEAKSKSLARYRDGHPLPPAKLGRGLLTAGQAREVTADTIDTPVTVVSYTTPEAAEALGRSLSCLRRWMADDIIPSPYLKETTRGTLCYSAGELTLIARILYEHESEFAYLAKSHNHVLERIRQEMHAYRMSNI